MDIDRIKTGMTVYVPDPETGEAEPFIVTAVDGAKRRVELDGWYECPADDVCATEAEAGDAAESMLEDAMESAHYASCGRGRPDAP